MSTPNDNQEQLDDAAQREAYELGYSEAKEQFATQGSFSSGRTYDSASLSEAYDTGVNAAEAVQALAEEKANQEKIGATVQAARASQREAAYKARQREGNIRHLARRSGATWVRGLDGFAINEQDLAKLLDERDALQAQRDELLLLVKEYSCGAPYSESIQARTDAAIARATEGGQGQ